MTATYICDECSCDGGDIKCVLKIDIGEPMYCPVTGEEMNYGEWYCQKE